MHHGIKEIELQYKLKPEEFDYGFLGAIPVFKEKHPMVMNDFIDRLNWKHKLNYTVKSVLNRPKLSHEKVKYQWLTIIENLLNNGKDIFGYSNWNRIKITNKK
jgi:hypothetical protein